MPDGTVPERVASELERKGVEAVKEAAESALESENPEKAKAEVQKNADTAIVEVKDYMGVATDPSDPSLTDEVRKKAEAVEAEIRAAADEARAKIDRVVSGDSSPSGSPEAEIAELKKENVTSATGETETLAKTEVSEASDQPLSRSEQRKLLKRKTETSEVVKEPDATTESAAEVAAESLTPESVMKGFADVAAEILQSKGKLSPALQGRYEELMRQRVKLKYGKDRDSWKPMETSAEGLANVVDRFSSHPVGMLQGFGTYLSEHPDIAARAGVSAEDVKKRLSESAGEIAANPKRVEGHLGQIASELLSGKGEYSPNMVNTMDRLRDELDLVREHSPEKMDEEAWKNISSALEHLQMIYSTTDAPVDRLKGLRAFIGDNPEIASAAGLTIESIDAAIQSEGAGIVKAKPEAVPIPAPPQVENVSSEVAQSEQKSTPTFGGVSDEEYEGTGGMPSAQMPDKVRGIDVEGGISKLGGYINDPGQAAVDLVDKLVGPSKGNKND
jgi:hypothetical protein